MSKDKFKQSAEHLKEWLDIQKQNNEIAPDVKKMVDILDWESNTVSNMPTTVLATSTDIDRIADDLYNKVSTQFPLPERINMPIIYEINSSTATSANVVATLVTTALNSVDLDAFEFAKTAIDDLHNIQQQQNYPNQIKELIQQVCPQELNYFNKALVAFDKYNADLTDPVACALEIRTYFDKLKGFLYEKARNGKKINMTDEKMFQLLYKGNKSENEIKKTLQDRSSIISDLSVILKRRQKTQTSEIKSLWSRVLNSTYILLAPLKESS